MEQLLAVQREPNHVFQRKAKSLAPVEKNHLLYLQVLLRMNLFVIVLTFSLNEPYQNYYFVPLISFWFIVQWITLSIKLPCKVNQYYI